MNKKDLLRICVYVAGFSIITISNVLLSQMIPSQIYKTFTTMGMVRFVISLLIFIIVFGGINLILRKYAQITSISKTRLISEIIIAALFAIGLSFAFVQFMNKPNNPVANPVDTVTVNGWLFEIKTPDGVKIYLIRDDGGRVIYLTESEILQAVGSDNWEEWIKTNSRWPLELWAQNCEVGRKIERSCSQDEFDRVKRSEKSFENWRIYCENYNQRMASCTLMPYEKYQTLMENFLHDYKINGSINDAYVIKIPITGIGQLFLQ